MSDSSSSSPRAGDTPELSDSSTNASTGSFDQTRVFTAQFENLDDVRNFIGEAASQCGLDESAVYAAQLAVDEAFTNIIEHAYDGESDELIECNCQIDDFGLSIRLLDCGKPFNPEAIPNPNLDADLEERDIGGLGLYFIRQLMDEVEFDFTRDPKTGKRCNILRMVKRKEV